jgi:hypothetical protein
MTTGSISPYAIQIPDVPPKKDERSPSIDVARNTHSLTLYGEGDAFIYSPERNKRDLRFNTQRFSSTGAQVENITPPADEKNDRTRRNLTLYCNLLSTDESGRFIVWMKSCGKRKGVVLHDTKSGKMQLSSQAGGLLQSKRHCS